MARFRPDNTTGFSSEELATLNDIYNHNLAIALADLPNGVVGTDRDTLVQIEKSVADAVMQGAEAAARDLADGHPRRLIRRFKGGK